MSGTTFQIYTGKINGNEISKNQRLAKSEIYDRFGINIDVAPNTMKDYAKRIAKLQKEPIIVMERKAEIGIGRKRSEKAKRIVVARRAVGPEKCFMIVLPEGDSIPCESLVIANKKRQ
ncbi:MAG: hypothetical protein KAU52_03690 [Methanosarcinales archaeon]|nr:hypothetical protein [Methanosarcinales archaeon]